MTNHNHTPSPEQTQSAIDTDGGLYDQALQEDAERTVRAQDEVYDTYEANIRASQFNDDRRIETLKKEKRKLTLKRIGGLAMWIPGLDVVGEMVQQSRTSAKIHKDRKLRYRQKNGSIGINLQKKWEKDSTANGSERRVVIEELSYLLEERKRRDGNLTGSN